MAESCEFFTEWQSPQNREGKNTSLEMDMFQRINSDGEYLRSEINSCSDEEIDKVVDSQARKKSYVFLNG